MAPRSCCWMLLILSAIAHAADPDPLQDFCVADKNSPIHVNGFCCKERSLVTADDFVYSGLVPANTNNPIGAAASYGFADQFPGLNTQGLGIARLDLAVGGVIPLHTHHLATEIVYVVEGCLYAGFVTTITNDLYAKQVNAGEVIVFPRGLMHFKRNVGNKPAWALAIQNSQSHGYQLVANAAFGAQPGIPNEVLEKTFFLNTDTINTLKGFFTPLS